MFSQALVRNGKGQARLLEPLLRYRVMRVRAGGSNPPPLQNQACPALNLWGEGSIASPRNPPASLLTAHHRKSYLFQHLLLDAQVDLPNTILSRLPSLRPACYQRDDILEQHVRWDPLCPFCLYKREYAGM